MEVYVLYFIIYPTCTPPSPHLNIIDLHKDSDVYHMHGLSNIILNSILYDCIKV